MRTIPKEVTKELIENLYVKKEKSLREIGVLVKKGPVQVSRYLKKFSIKARPFSEKGRKPWNKGVPMKQESKDKLRKAHLGKKLSPEHRAKVIKALQPFWIKGEKNPNWKGGKYYKSDSFYQDKRGWVYLRKPSHPNAMSNGYVAEHRYIMSEHIGRPLKSLEHIHHLNGVKSDNRIENLELVNGHTHCLLTKMESRIKELEAENEKLRKLV